MRTQRIAAQYGMIQLGMSAWLLSVSGLCHAEAAPDTFSRVRERLTMPLICPAEGVDEPRGLLREGPARVVLFEHRAVQDEVLSVLQLLPCRAGEVSAAELAGLWWLLGLSQYYAAQEAGALSDVARNQIVQLFAHALLLQPELRWDKAVLGEEGLSLFEAAQGAVLTLPRRRIQVPDAAGYAVGLDGQRPSASAPELEVTSGMHLITWSDGKHEKHVWWSVDLEERMVALPGPRAAGFLETTGHTGALHSTPPLVSDANRTGPAEPVPSPSSQSAAGIELSAGLLCWSLPLSYCGAAVEPALKMGSLLSLHLGGGMIGHLSSSDTVSESTQVALVFPVYAGARVRTRWNAITLSSGLSWQAMLGGGFSAPRTNPGDAEQKSVQSSAVWLSASDVWFSHAAAALRPAGPPESSASTPDPDAQGMIQGLSLEGLVRFRMGPLEPRFRLTGGILVWPNATLLPQASLELGLTWGGADRPNAQNTQARKHRASAEESVSCDLPLGLNERNFP